MAVFTCFGVKKIIRRKRLLSNESDFKKTSSEEDDEDHHEDYTVSRKLPSKRKSDFHHVKKFSWDEMEKISENFMASRAIGYGGFSTVYLADFPDSSHGAIKVYSGASDRLTRIFKQELEILLKLEHENIVEFLGYCDDHEEGVLVFEYVSNGTLQEKLHGAKKGKGSALSWRNRMSIAFQLARAIEYLHEKCPLQIVHGDIKASNILLDEELNCKLCDFGSAKLGFSSAVLSPSCRRMDRMMMGSPGYTDPHYMRTGLASKKNDIYSFGVVLLELITGLEALSSVNGERLAAKAGPALNDPEKVDKMVDPRLPGGAGFDMEEVRTMASLAAMCLSGSPSLRPGASDVIHIMRNRVDSIAYMYTSDDK